MINSYRENYLKVPLSYLSYWHQIGPNCHNSVVINRPGLSFWPLVISRKKHNASHRLLWIYRYIPFSPLLFIVSITLLISFWLLLFKPCYLETTDTFLHFSHQKCLLFNNRNVENMFRTHRTCSDILGNFLLRQVASKALCST